MAKFSLQRVLELRERREQALAIRLTEARTRAEEARIETAAIESLRETSDAQWQEASTSIRTVGAMQNATYVRAQLDQQLEEARELVRTAEAEVAARLSEFTIALQERRVLDRLKEKRMEATNLEEGRADQAATDEIALSRFARREPAGAGGGS